MIDVPSVPRIPFIDNVQYPVPSAPHDGFVLQGPGMAGTDVMGLFSYVIPEIDSMLYDDYVGS